MKVQQSRKVKTALFIKGKLHFLNPKRRQERKKALKMRVNGPIKCKKFVLKIKGKIPKEEAKVRKFSTLTQKIY